MKEDTEMPESKRAKIYPEPGQKINENSLFRLQQLARDQVFEPFEGRKSLETIQKTRGGIEKGVEQVKDAGMQAGKWLNKSKFAKLTKSKFKDLVAETKEKQSQGPLGSFLKKMDHATEDFQKTAKNKLKFFEEKTREITLAYIKKGLEILLYEDHETWVIDKANLILERGDLQELEQIRNLSFEDKQKLVEKLYPYNNPALAKYSKSFDTTVNITLGAIVATNIPGTGLLVSLINMGKTLVKLGNRLNTMSGIYGLQVASPQSLFRVSAKILKSLEDWENNAEHLPLDPMMLEELYQSNPDDDEQAFKNLMEEVVRKEAYIAIPGIGMISLGKINLDDLKMDLVIRHLVENYVALQELRQLAEAEQIQQTIQDFTLIYSAFLQADYFKVMRKQQEEEELEAADKKWKVRMKLLSGIDMALKESSSDLDHWAYEIYQRIQSLEQDQKQTIIQEEVACLLGNENLSVLKE